jgi:hypothetical protein
MSERRREGSWSGAVVVAIPVLIALAIGLGSPSAAPVSSITSPPSAPATTPDPLLTLIEHIPADRFAPDETTIADCPPDDDPCLEQAFANYAYANGGKAAIAYWKEQAAISQRIEANCHQITHLIGAGAIAKWKGDVAEAYADGDESCWSGYYHGIMQAAIGKFEAAAPEVLAPKVAALCDSDSIREVDWISWQCVHGIGHGLLITTGYDLAKTIDTCIAMPTEMADRQTCANGAFMENVTPSLPGVSAWLNEQPDYPCTVVPETVRGDCYGYSGHRSLMLSSGDYTTAGSFCARMDELYVNTCFSSIGHMAAAAAVNRLSGIIELCTQVATGGGDPRGGCWVGASIDVYAATVDPARAAEVCGAATAGAIECYNSVGTMLRATARPGDDPIGACDLHTPPGEARAACRVGAGDQ